LRFGGPGGNRAEAEGETSSDLVGLLLTAACVVDCRVLPVALLVSGYALLIGFRRHRGVVVVWVGAAGLLLTLAAAAHLFGRTTEAALTVVGAVIVGAAHALNLRLHAACAHG
jgi:hypothetical protein